MVTIILCGLLASCGVFLLGRLSKRLNIVTLKDTLKTKGTEARRKQNAALQLQNEIAASGALKLEELENGDYKVTLKVVL
jgi:hypothetical protein